MRHEKLCDAVRQLCEELSAKGQTISEIPTSEVVDACETVIPDATPNEMATPCAWWGRSTSSTRPN
jgi:hypothetical protein